MIQSPNNLYRKIVLTGLKIVRLEEMKIYSRRNKYNNKRLIKN